MKKFFSVLVALAILSSYVCYGEGNENSVKYLKSAEPYDYGSEYVWLAEMCIRDSFYAKEGVTQTEICRRTFQSKQTVNLIIKNLSADGYVTVTEVRENKRSKLVRMTEAGRSYCEKVVRHITWAEDTAMSMFTPEEQKQPIDRCV